MLSSLAKSSGDGMVYMYDWGSYALRLGGSSPLLSKYASTGITSCFFYCLILLLVHVIPAKAEIHN